jgi:hypothetical protein
MCLVAGLSSSLGGVYAYSDGDDIRVLMFSNSL